MPFTYVVTDAGYSDNPQFLAGLEERGVSYVCGVERTFGVRRPDEVKAAAAPAPPPSLAKRGKGRPKLLRPAPLHTVEAVRHGESSMVAAVPEESWRLVTWWDGSNRRFAVAKGPLQKQFVALRVHRATGNPEVGPYGRSAQHPWMSTGEEGWLFATAIEDFAPAKGGSTTGESSIGGLAACRINHPQCPRTDRVSYQRAA